MIRNATSRPPYTNYWVQLRIGMKYQYKFDIYITILKGTIFRVISLIDPAVDHHKTINPADIYTHC